MATQDQSEMEQEITLRKTQLINDAGEELDVLLEVEQEDVLIDENTGHQLQYKSKRIVQPFQAIIGSEGTTVNVDPQSQSSRQIIRGADYHSGWVEGYRMCLKDVREQKLRVRRNGPWGRILFRPGEGVHVPQSKLRKTRASIPGKAAMVIDAVAQVLPNKSAPASATCPIEDQVMPKVEVKKEVKEEIILEMVEDDEGGVRISQQTDELEDASSQLMECLDYPDSTIESNGDQ